jgi:hypothetical protein
MLSSDNTDNSYGDGILSYANQGSTIGSPHSGIADIADICSFQTLCFSCSQRLILFDFQSIENYSRH